MSTATQQYCKNALQPPQINQSTLQQTLKELQHAVIQGTKVLQAGSQAPVNSADHSSIYSGTAGIVLAFLRLERQKDVLGETKLPGFGRLASERIIPVGNVKIPPPGYMSPVGSSLGPLAMRVLAALEHPGQSVSQNDINLLNTAVQRSLGHGHVVSSSSGDHIRGVDEVLYGRAGLLWVVISIRYYRHMLNEMKVNTESLFEAIPKLVKMIIDGGRRGARDYVKNYGEKGALPLMWVYKDERYSLGANNVHGIAGILTTLLSCEVEELNPYLPLIAETITGICRISIANDGHLPSSIPSRSRSRGSPLVQICHGAPGLLILLATARKSTHLRTHWKSEWDEAIYLGAERVWQEGLLSKGGSLCHGLTGNAWSLLALHESFEIESESEGNEKSDNFLSRALTLLLLARETPPYSTVLGIPSGYDFRMPDRPYSLYEGLAGEICAWAEACVVVQARLCKETGQREKHNVKGKALGFPCLGGNGVRGAM